MSNEIYPLDEEYDDMVFEELGATRKRSVNQRLAPIFRALLDDPEGWEYEAYDGEGAWDKIGVDDWFEVAPKSHIHPGDWRESLCEVWREDHATR